MNVSYYGLSAQDWVALSLIPGVGPGRLSRLWTYLASLSQSQEPSLFSEFSEPESAAVKPVDFQLLRALGWSQNAARLGMRFLQQGSLPSEAEACFEATWRWLESPDHAIIFRTTPHYPPRLEQIAVAPTFLYVKGNFQAWEKTSLGVVGARQASGYGKKMALMWSQQLSERGLLISSGGARGIDAHAHQGALNAKSATVAIMGTGLLNLYPRQNHRLFEQILEHNGALVSEYSLMTEVRPQLFPPRNRIISGMSAGVLVVEASERSGSLISARYALEENREVFAIPGRIGDPQSTGTHLLIRQGATLATSVDDILEELPSELQQRQSTIDTIPIEQPDAAGQQAQIQALSPVTNALLILIQTERIAMDFDALVRATGFAASDLSQSLMELELSGLVANTQGQYQFVP